MLCINGAWGVGKTFLWRQALDQLRKAGSLPFTRYSYVSLFGLNSLDDVKSALFENMEWLDQDATMRRVKELMEEALQMVGRHSLLNELRVKKYGVSV